MKKIEGKYNPKDFEEKYIKIGKKRNILSQVWIKQSHHFLLLCHHQM